MTEYHSKGSLGDLVLKRNEKNEQHNKECTEEKRPLDKIMIGLTQQEVRLYLIDILKAIYYCHNVIKVIHRDIKPENIMINHNEEAVLIDFGVSALVDK